jgi:hypothetical protein
MKKLWFYIFGLLLIFQPCNVFASDRCIQYHQSIRVQYTKFFGSGYPFHYAVGKIRQESNCRADITAFDGGMGLSQFMPKTERDVERQTGWDLNMYNPEHAIKAQAFYMSQLHRQNPDGRLWIDEMFYNSGAGTTKKEAARAGAWDYDRMKAICKRKILVLKSGKLLDLCDVGYDYPKKIYFYGQKYKEKSDGEWRYW